MRYLQIDECTRLFNTCEPDFRELVRGALVTGCRFGELCRADVRDFNRDSASLSYARARAARRVWIPLDDAAAAFLRHPPGGPGEPLFREPMATLGQVASAPTAARGVQSARIEPAIGFHILRHTWASLQVMAGCRWWWPPGPRALRHRMVEKHYGHLAQSYVRRSGAQCSALQLGPIESNVAPIRSASHGMKKTKQMSVALSRLSTKANTGGIVADDWQMWSPILFEIKAGMHGRTGRDTDRDEILSWLDELAAGRPITPAMKHMAEQKFPGANPPQAEQVVVWPKLIPTLDRHDFGPKLITACCSA